MRYVIVDHNGASHDYFDDARELLEAIDEIERDDSASLAEIMVLRYDDQGARVGDPIEAVALVAHDAESVLSNVGGTYRLTYGVASAYVARDWQLSSHRSPTAV